MTIATPQIYKVPEISCDHCVQAITNSVSPVDGVESVDVDLEAKTVTVVGGKKENIIAAIDDAGYDVA